MVSLGGERIYLGKFDSPKSHERYEQAIAVWRKLLPKKSVSKDADPQEVDSQEVDSQPTTVDVPPGKERIGSRHLVQ